ncbi:hypothetical protein [Uliginosibacterium sp. 31-12]|uniref:hypothetical protein n=1 Tax=Uliginosibacterium sp. 31-12 TaxID=3062781 RepID=UPI0026E1E97A|nr:hypothetical protein [Uliginosibacterium sp. 31-12]MDO6387052.1 hypothetical protein [Uliginosibacterium sp. 31-12]
MAPITSNAVYLAEPEFSYFVIKILVAAGFVLGLATLGLSSLLARPPRKAKIMKKIAICYFSTYAILSASLLWAMDSAPGFSISSRFEKTCEAAIWIALLASFALVFYAYFGSRFPKRPKPPKV